MYQNTNDYFLAHYGVKGMKWGVRRAVKKYAKLTDRANAETSRDDQKRYVKAWNKAADDMNNGGIDKYNRDYAKKLGSKAKNHDYDNDEEYIKGYHELFEKRLIKYHNEMTLNDILNNVNYKKAKKLCDKYSLTEVDELVRKREGELDKIRKTIEEV